MFEGSVYAQPLLLLCALLVACLNTFVLGGFVGRATTLHADLDGAKGRRASQIVVAMNAALAALCLVALIFWAARRSCG